MSSEGVARGSLFVLSAPSGTGKSSIVRRLLEELSGLEFSVSATTRVPRPDEQDGVEYHFLSREAFEDRLERGDFLEHAEVHGNLYGTLRSETERRLSGGLDLLLDIDVQGAEQVAESGLPSVLVFLLPPSRDELERRLRARGSESEESLGTRLEAARREIERVGLFHHVVLNDELDQAVRDVEAIVRSERSRLAAAWPVVKRVLATFEEGA